MVAVISKFIGFDIYRHLHYWFDFNVDNIGNLIFEINNMHYNIDGDI